MRTMCLICLTVVSALWVMATASTAAVWYVDALNGNDGTGDGSRQNPWKTLTYTLTVLKSAGTEEDPCIIHVAPGIYSPSANGETFPLKLGDPSQYSPDQYISLLGAGRDSTIIDGERTGGRVLKVYGHYMTVADLTITGGGHPDPDRICAGLSVSDNYLREFTLQRCTIRDNEGMGLRYFRESSRVTIRDCVFMRNCNCNTDSGGGAYFAYWNKVTMTNCLVANNCAGSDSGTKGGGLFFSYGVHATLTNCSIVDNNREGIFVAYVPGSFRLYNCIVWGNERGDLGTVEGYDHCPYIYHCNMADGDCEGENGNICEDPLFVSGPQGDYYLSHAGVNAKKKEQKKAK